MKIRTEGEWGGSVVLGVLKLTARPLIVDKVEGIEVVITTVEGHIKLYYSKAEIKTLATNYDGCRYTAKLVSEILSKSTNCLDEVELDEYIKRVLTADVPPCE